MFDRDDVDDELEDLDDVDMDYEEDDLEVQVEAEIGEAISGYKPKPWLGLPEEMQPEWEPIKRFKGYFVSKAGKVRGPRGILKGRKNPLSGYWDVSLRGKAKYIHLLVWNQWNGKVRKGNIVSHENGNKDHNYLSNLKESTKERNMFIHAIQRKAQNGKAKRNS